MVRERRPGRLLVEEPSSDQPIQDERETFRVHLLARRPDETLREAYVPRLAAYREAFPKATETDFDVNTRSQGPEVPFALPRPPAQGPSYPTIEAQRILSRTYCEGEFPGLADVQDGAEFVVEAKKVGDTLFAFMALELSEHETSAGLGEAVDNLRKALSQVQDVLAAVEEAHEAAPIPTPGA